MIEIIDASNIHLHAEAMEQAYRLRHEVFVGEMGWTDLARPDGREIDQFDDDRAVHMICRRDGQVIGYQRMLPTTRPHLLSEVMPQLCEVERPVGLHVWEWTRYCVAKQHRDRGRKLSPIGNALLTGIVEWGLATGMDRVVIEMNPIWLLRLAELKFLPLPLGIPKDISGDNVMAVEARFDRRTLQMLRDMRGEGDRPVLRQALAA